MRRLFATVLACAAGLGLVLSPLDAGQDPLKEKAHRLHRDALVLDTHADLTPFLELDTRVPLIGDTGMAGPAYDPAADAARQPVLPTDAWYRTFPPGPWRFTERHRDGYMDLPRMREGGLDAQFFAVYMEEEPRPGMAVRRALDQIDAIHTLCEKYPREIALATRADEVVRTVKSGRIAVLIGLEGGYMIEDDLRALRTFSRLGVRYMTLTHMFNTNWADSSGVGPPIAARHNGLSPFGRVVVGEMNRLGMLVDVSHGGDKTFYDVLAVTKAPVIASHSGCRAVKNHPRNMSDDMLRALAKNGGVIQIDAVTKYINPAIPVDAAPKSYTDQLSVREPPTPLSIFIDHIAHAIQVAGPDHVGLGLDYGFGVPAPVGLEDVSKLEAITYELLARGFDENTVRKVLGDNTLRVMREAERVAAQLADKR
jgi:membrane dipeptidase